MLFSAIFFLSCEEKLELATETDNNQSVITKLTLNQILGEINHPEIQSKISEVNKKLVKNNTFGRFVVSDSVFTKYENLNFPTTYFVTLNSYSEAEPYFLKMIITIEENEPKLCFIKYIPENQTDTLELINYSGEIQVLDIDENIKARTFFINGIPLTTTQNSKTSRTENVCYDEVSIIEVFCSHSGEHGVGDVCTPPLLNDAHFVMKITTLCQTNYRLPSRIYEDTIFPPRNGGGGGDSSQTLVNNFVNTLDPTEKEIYYSDPEIQNYLLNNIIQPPTINPTLQPTNNSTPPKIIDPKAIQFIEEVIVKIKNDPTVYKSIVPFLIEKQIDDTQLDICSKSVFQQIKKTKNCDFAFILAKLNADKSVYNTIIKSEVAPSGAPAQTVKDSPFKYSIYISTDYTSKTKLFIATILLHEMVHAYFMSIFDDYYNGNPSNPNSYDDFSYLFDLYVNKKYPNSQAASIHHQQMAVDYVNAISSALKEYQPGLPQQVYDDMAYGSISDSPAVFDVLFSAGNPNRQRIINRYACEQAGHPIDAGKPQEQNPHGQTCN